MNCRGGTEPSSVQRTSVAIDRPMGDKLNEHGGVRGASLAGLDRGLAGDGAPGHLAAAPEVRAGRARNADRAVLAATSVIAAEPNLRNFGLTGRAGDPDIYAGFGTARAWDTQVMFAKLMLRMAGAHRLPNGTIANNANPYRFPDGTVADNDQQLQPCNPCRLHLSGPICGARHHSQFRLGGQPDVDGDRATGTCASDRCCSTRSMVTVRSSTSSAFELPQGGEGFRTMLRTSPIARPAPGPVAAPSRRTPLPRTVPTATFRGSSNRT